MMVESRRLVAVVYDLFREFSWPMSGQLPAAWLSRASIPNTRALHRLVRFETCQGRVAFDASLYESVRADWSSGSARPGAEENRSPRRLRSCQSRGKSAPRPVVPSLATSLGTRLPAR